MAKARVASRATAPDPRLEKAQEILARAVEDYRGARFEQALERTREAEAVLADLGDVRAARALVARSAFVEGSARAALGETERAKQAFARVHASDPSFEPPEGWLSPRLAELYSAGQPR